MGGQKYKLNGIAEERLSGFNFLFVIIVKAGIVFEYAGSGCVCAEDEQILARREIRISVAGNDIADTSVAGESDDVRRFEESSILHP